ncbi:MAG TPA: sulfite exporter TauE/SafE family protein [Burkholderiales bacterium]|nr:sulfite exporter TauE/SafE family protein [Burkholderiales bacterium]
MDDFPGILLPAALVVLAAYLIFGVSGFGSTLVAIPLLAHLLPLRFAIPVVVLLDAIASASQGFRLRSGAMRSEVLLLVPFMLAGMAAGVTLLIRLPREPLLAALGLLVIGFGLSYLVRRRSALRFGRWVAAPVGLFAGTLSALFSIGGPLYVMYLAGRGAAPEQVRATMPAIFLFTTVSRIALFAATGLFTREVLVTAALLAPAMLAGLWAGNRLHLKLSRENAVRVIGGLLTLSGASLVFRALS